MTASASDPTLRESPGHPNGDRQPQLHAEEHGPEERRGEDEAVELVDAPQEEELLVVEERREGGDDDGGGAPKKRGLGDGGGRGDGAACPAKKSQECGRLDGQDWTRKTAKRLAESRGGGGSERGPRL